MNKVVVGLIDGLGYRTEATRIGTQTAWFLTAWRDLGHSVVVIADHGMNADGYHGGTLDNVLDVPFCLLEVSVDEGSEFEAASQRSCGAYCDGATRH